MTTYENMVLNETFKREGSSKIEWGRQHSDQSVFPLDSQEYAKLSDLKSKVADLCDLQPTPVSMVRPARKVHGHHVRSLPCSTLGALKNPIKSVPCAGNAQSHQE